MRKLLVLGLAATLLLAATPAWPTDEPGVFVQASRDAGAHFLRLSGDHGEYFFVIGAHVVSSRGARTYAVLGRGKCEKFRGKHMTVIFCSASGRARTIPEEAFEIDPLLERASLRVKSQGRRHRMSWSATSPAPFPDASAYPSQDFSYAYAAAYRDARAKGSLFGRTVKTRRLDFAWMSEGADAFVFAGDREARRWVETRPDGTKIVHSRLRIEIPR
ncbi:MAG: hypothetical protein ACRDKZ_11490 [Actinomycetota bacterium]